MTLPMKLTSATQSADIFGELTEIRIFLEMFLVWVLGKRLFAPSAEFTVSGIRIVVK